MKKILLIITLCLVMAMFVAVPCYADTTDTEATESVVPENTEADNTETIAPEDTESGVTVEEVSPNFFTRIYDFFLAHKTEIITLISSAVLVFLNVQARSGNKQINKSQTATIGGVNQLIEGYDGMLAVIKSCGDSFNIVMNETKTIHRELSVAVADMINAVKELKVTDADLANDLTEKYAVIHDILDKEMAQNTALMDVLSSVYTNSRGLPQGVKDLVALKRAENIRIVEAAHELEPKNDGGSDV